MSDSPLPRPLLARYRRPLTFGGLLDQTIQVWRQIWLPCAVVMGMANLPFLALAASRLGSTGSGQAPTLGLVGPILLAAVGTLLATVLAGGAVWGGLVFVESCALWLVLRIVVSTLGVVTTVLFHDHRQRVAEPDLATIL